MSWGKCRTVKGNVVTHLRVALMFWKCLFWVHYRTDFLELHNQNLS